MGAYFIAIDPSNRVWVSTEDTDLYELTQGGANGPGSPYTFPNNQYGVTYAGFPASETNGNMYFGFQTEDGLLEISNPGTSATKSIYPDSALPQIVGGSYLAIDSSGYIWTYGYTTSGSVFGLIKSNTAGANVGSYPNPSLKGYAPAIDGLGNVWIGNYADNATIEVNNSGTLLSPADGYTGGVQNYPILPAIDGSGNVWLPGPGSTPDGTTIVELIGAAAPVVTPISPVYPGTASTNGLGVRP